MRAVDTNVVVVRYLAADDAAQTRRARALIDGGDVWLSQTVVLETEWVLRSSYRFSPKEIVAAFRTLAGQPTVSVENPAALADALRLCEAGIDFAAALHVSAAPREIEFATFDATLVNAAKRLGLSKVCAA